MFSNFCHFFHGIICRSEPSTKICHALPLIILTISLPPLIFHNASDNWDFLASSISQSLPMKDPWRVLISNVNVSFLFFGRLFSNDYELLKSSWEPILFHISNYFIVYDNWWICGHLLQPCFFFLKEKSKAHNPFTLPIKPSLISLTIFTFTVPLHTLPVFMFINTLQLSSKFLSTR